MVSVGKKSSRKATLAKLKRDAENLKKYARFALILRDSVVEVIDNGDRRMGRLPYARIIAVLGPVQYGESFLAEGNLLEVGYSRTRPYSSTDLRLKDENGNRSRRRWFLKSRPRVRPLSGEETARVYPHIAECMRTIVIESSAHWQTRTWHMKKKPGYAKGPGEVERGIYFTVNRSDELLHRQFSLEDVRHRKEKYILRHASWVRWLFKEYTLSNHAPKRLKGFAKARRIAEMLSQEHYTPFYRMVLCRQFEKDSHTRLLLDSIVEAFDIDASITDKERCILEPASVLLPLLVHLGCYRTEQPTVHARGSTVFEIFLEKSHRLSLERSNSEQTAEDEVPF